MNFDTTAYEQKVDRRTMVFALLIALGILLRFFCMAWGHDYDWESYRIVGALKCYGLNVYAETTRYNYGPIFFWVQGTLFRIAMLNSFYFEEMYRCMMVSFLTCVDLGIMYVIARKYSMKAALIFFLNPISIIITGYQNQFDNLAILLALLTVYFYNEDQKFNKKDIGFILSFALCLTTKHILFLIPVFLLLRPGLTLIKRGVYACVPVVLFLLSFVPYIQTEAAFNGVKNNVFGYRSVSNAPLLQWLYDLISFPEEYKIVVYGLLMVVIAVLTRKYTFEKQLYVYLIAMVCFSSAVQNQYLAIPMLALCVLETGALKYVYMIGVGIYLALNNNGLRLGGLAEKMPSIIGNAMDWYDAHGYVIAVWILLITLIYILRKNRLETVTTE